MSYGRERIDERNAKTMQDSKFLSFKKKKNKKKENSIISNQGIESSCRYALYIFQFEY